jgi:hypothetical protein
MAGQSNMVGYADSSELEAPYDSAQTNVAYWFNTRWVDVAPGYGRARRDFGPEISFGHAVKAALPSEDIYLVKYAVGGSNLYDQWRPDGGPYHAAWVTKVTMALAKLKRDGVDYEISGMLWLQGETDADHSKGAVYQANLRAFIASMRAETFGAESNTPDMLFMIARVRDYYGTAVQSALVRDAQVAVAESDTNAEWFDTDTFGPLIEGGHYGATGQLEIGKAFADTYLNRPELLGNDNFDDDGSAKYLTRAIVDPRNTPGFTWGVRKSLCQVGSNGFHLLPWRVLGSALPFTFRLPRTAVLMVTNPSYACAYCCLLPNVCGL